MSFMQHLPRPPSVEQSQASATHNARDLIPNGVKAEIELDGQTYTLRITRAGKLILTK